MSVFTRRAARIFSVFRGASKGCGLRGKWLAMLLSVYGGLGAHRLKTHRFILGQFDRLADRGLLDLHLKGRHRTLVFSMRHRNEGDYAIGAELVRTPYLPPPFPPEHIIDGGANIGMFAILANSYFPGMRVTCYEPDESNVRQLVRNLGLNAVNADVRQKGLWSADGTLYFRPGASQLGVIAPEPPGVPVPCVLPDVPPRCWMKLDIEGAEFEVVPALLRSGRRPAWLSMEVHYWETRGAGLLALLRERGYTVDLGEGRETRLIQARLAHVV